MVSLTSPRNAGKTLRLGKCDCGEHSSEILMMKRRRKVILIACSLAVLALFVGIAWLKANGDFYPLDRSGMMLSPVETARWLFSDDVENGVMLISQPSLRCLTLAH